MVRLSSSTRGATCAMLVAVLIGCIAALLVREATAAKSESGDRWAQLQQLVDQSSNVLTFTSVNSYTKFVQNSGRNYDIFVMLTASKNVGCAMCSEWEEAFVEVAGTAKAQQPNEKIAFGLVKFETLPEVFRSYSLNHAPVILYVAHDLQETKTIVPKLTMNLANLEAAFPDPIAQFVTQRSGRKVEIIYSPWPRILTMCGVLVVGTIAGRRLALIFVPILRNNKWLWFIFSIMLYGLGVSGSIYSYLRNVPNHGWDQKTKRPIYFAGDRAQYFYEGIIIWAILVGGGVFIVVSAYGNLPQMFKPIRPVFNLVCLGAFGALFRYYVSLYLTKASWYKYGMSSELSWPWL